MSLPVSQCLRFSVAALLAAAASATYAQTTKEGTLGSGKSTLDEIQRMVEDALPPIIGSENTALAEQLVKPPLAPSLSQTFVLKNALSGAFGLASPVFAPECSRTGTPVKDPDQGECNATSGTPDSAGKFSQLSFSKNLGVGNIRFLSRPAFDEKFDPKNLKSVANIPDATALAMAQAFLSKNFGLPVDPTTGAPLEFPLPPATAAAANASLFVSSLAVAGAGAQGETFAPVMIQKVVQVPRGIRVNLTDPKTKQVVMPFVPAPGVARVMIDGNKQVVAAILENWQELRIDPSLEPRLAKTRQDLAAEIAHDLQGDGGGRIAHVSAHIVYSSDWRGTFGLLLPAVQVYVAPATGELSPGQFEQIIGENIGTAGIVREYPLIGRPLRPDATVPGR
jgi:hypothetical protein